MQIYHILSRQCDYYIKVVKIKCLSNLWGFLINGFTSSKAIIVVCSFLSIENSLSWIFKVQGFWIKVKILSKLARLLLFGVIIEGYGCLEPSGLVFIAHLLAESICFRD